MWIEAALAAANATLGAYRYFHAKKQAKENVRPQYNIDPSYQQGIDTLENNIGLPQSALDLYYRNAGQAGTNGINAINANGGNANNIAQLVNNQMLNYKDVAVADGLQKKQDISQILAAKAALAEQKDKAFQLNQFDPYKDKAQAISGELAAGFTQIGQGLNSASMAASNAATAKLAEQYKLAGDNTTNVTTPNSGVNINSIYQSINGAPKLGNNQNNLGMFDPNQLSISNIPQTPQNFNFSQPQAPNPYYNNLYFNQQQQPNLSMYNPNQMSLYNNPYQLNF